MNNQSVIPAAEPGSNIVDQNSQKNPDWQQTSAARSVLVLFLFISHNLLAQVQPNLGDLSDGSRATPVHLIQLIDEDSSVIRLDEQPLLPFSTKFTCGGKCHNYERIKHGWHFNSLDTVDQSGRPGASWIYVDQQTFTQIPISFRNWPGVYKPQQLGLKTLQFLQIFGRQMPGGGVGEEENARQLTDLFRWRVSGNLEINCLGCHNAESAYDPAEYAAQTGRQNFRWAATAASGIASVRGSAKTMPDNYDLYWGAAPDQPQDLPPQVIYNTSRFNYKQEVYFNITCDIPDRNCYFCHSVKVIDSSRTERWQLGQDVHLAAGMKCVDCHQNGLDHHIIRGYEEETVSSMTGKNKAFTCTGCHLKKTEQANTDPGNLAAPRPAHRGIPSVHFERLTCTACHAGEWPGPLTRWIKTAITHGLGVKGINKSEQILPHIISPVLAEQVDGKIAPHNMVWPSFWAMQQGDTITPLAPEVISPLLKSIILNDDSTGTGDWLKLDDSLLTRVLDTLKTIKLVTGEPVFINGGKLYRKNSKGKIITQNHSAAEPYLWPLAHDIRPAARSLGIRGCSDCHALNAPLYFGKVEIDTPLKLTGKTYSRMIDYRSQTKIQAVIFSFSFLFRPWLKFVIIFAVVVIMAVVLLYAFKGLAAVLVKFTAGEE